MAIELHGGPLNGRLWEGPMVPTIDGYPVDFTIRDDLKIVAVKGQAKIDLELILGYYFWSGLRCEDGHKIYEWHMPKAKWN